MVIGAKPKGLVNRVRHLGSGVMGDVPFPGFVGELHAAQRMDKRAGGEVFSLTVHLLFKKTEDDERNKAGHKV